MASKTIFNYLYQLIRLLRWDKPSGRLILLIPAGWSLWMAPSAPPSESLVLLIITGGLFSSGAGCIANDIWDLKIDSQVLRTKNRPLATGNVHITTAFGLLFLMLILCLLIVFSLPPASIALCLTIAILALPLILIYPSAKRWFAYPQAILSICWGFAVLIPWAANEASITLNIPLVSCWGATMMWTFGFDTVYAMADSYDDQNLGLNSSALTLGNKTKKIVAISYAITCLLIAMGGHYAGVSWVFWCFWIIVTFGMQREAFNLPKSNFSASNSGRHFKNQVLIGGLMLLGLILGRAI